jgi:regulator of RNase E activity RraA
MSEEEIFRLVRERLFTAVIGDAMDAMGLTRQFLPPDIRALNPEMSFVGRAMPVLEADLKENDNWEDAAFGLMFRALDSLQKGEVYICTGASPLYALWGGLMSTKAMSLGASAAVLDGYHRDTREILDLGFPVFSAGAYAQDQRLRGRVVDFRCEIEFANRCRVAPGDLLVGDVDGVLVVPKNAVDDVLNAALAKVAGEEDVRRSILRGDGTAEIFKRTGIM